MDTTDAEKTAFTTPQGGQYQVNVLSFGSCNAPATFCRLMDVVLSGLNWRECMVYVDDIVVSSKTWDQHVRTLRTIGERRRAAGLQLNEQGRCPPRPAHSGQPADAPVWSTQESQPFLMGRYASADSRHRRCWTASERECIALVWGVEEYNMYLYGRRFFVVTDHAVISRAR